MTCCGREAQRHPTLNDVLRKGSPAASERTQHAQCLGASSFFLFPPAGPEYTINSFVLTETQDSSKCKTESERERETEQGRCIHIEMYTYNKGQKVVFANPQNVEMQAHQHRAEPNVALILSPQKS